MSQTDRPRPWWRRPGIAGLIVLLVLCGTAIAINIHSEGRRLPYDKGELHIYFLAAERMIAGEEISRPEDLKPYTYPPGMVLPFIPLTVLPEHSRRPIWYACNVLLLVWVLRMLTQVLRAAQWPTGSRRRKTAFVFVCALLASRHVYSVFENQSHDLLVLAAVMLGIRASCLSGEGRAGFGPGVGAALKATPLLFLPLYIWQRRAAAAAALVAGLALFLLLPDLLFVRNAGGSWTMGWLDTFVLKVQAVGGTSEKVGNAWAAWNILNQNLAGSIYRLFTEVTVPNPNTWDVSLLHLGRGQLKLLTALAQLGVLAAILWGARPSRSRALTGPALVLHRLGEASLVVCGMVLLSPMSSKAHFGVLLLPVCFCVGHQFFGRRSKTVMACMLVMLGAALTTKGIVGRPLGREILAHGSVTAATLAAMLGTLRILCVPQRDQPDD